MRHLEPIERKELLRIARSTLREHLALGLIPPGKPHRESLLVPGGAFVTLKTRGGRLRGCIGTFAATAPIYQAVQEMAVAAGTRDPRFPAVTEDELDELELEISVLSPREPLSDATLIEVGSHGLSIALGHHRGVLLPQVPVEHGWNRDAFLRQVCIKAGLNEEAWQDPDALLEIFTAQVFSESDADLLD